MTPSALGSTSDSLRRIALLAVLAGAIGSLGLALEAGLRHSPPLLVVLIGLWVLSPFVAYLLVRGLSRRWPSATQTALHVVAIVLTLGTLIVYATVAFGPPSTKPAAMFVLIPPLSLVPIFIVSLVAFSSRARGDATV